jgi:DNA-binding transcriptional LysR family regulator
MAVTLRQMEVFDLTMQTRNLTETARLLGVSQPAVSQTLRELEAQLGLALFVRIGNRISPTGEARALLPEATRLLTQLGTLEGRAEELRDAGAGMLLLASMPNVAACILPPALATFASERPRVRVRLNAFVIREVVRQVRNEGADLGFVYAPVDDPAVAIEPLMTAPMVCVLPAGHRLAQNEAVAAADFANERVILLDPANTPGLHLHRRLDEAGIRMQRALETNLSFAALGLVRGGLGVYVTEPTVLLSGLGDGLTLRPLLPDLPVTLVAIYGRQRPVPRPAIRFMTHLQTSVAQLCARLDAMGCRATPVARGAGELS